MSNLSDQPDLPLQPADHARIARESFCIHAYAGEQGQRCGWRGLINEIPRDPKTGARVCPRCGRTTLMDLPATSSETP